MAALTYLILFFLFLAEILTGFALYAQSHVGQLWKVLGGWLFTFFSAGYVRLFHHSIMWLVILFVAIHFYIAWYDDIREKVGAKSSIFSGYKSVEEE